MPPWDHGQAAGIDPAARSRAPSPALSHRDRHSPRDGRADLWRAGSTPGRGRQTITLRTAPIEGRRAPNPSTPNHHGHPLLKSPRAGSLQTPPAA